MIEITKRCDIYIFGVLGGVGSSLAENLLKSGYHVTGIDNALLASSSPLHTRYIYNNLSSCDSFHMIQSDARNIHILEQLININQPKKTIVYYCCGFPHGLLKNIQENTIEDVLWQTPVRMIDLFHSIKTPDETIFIFPQHKPSAFCQDEYSHLLQAEEKLLDDCNNCSSCTFVQLPLLIGAGQSVTTFPVQQLWRLCSDSQSDVSALQEKIQLLALDRLLTTFQTALDPAYNPRSSLLQKQVDLYTEQHPSDLILNFLHKYCKKDHSTLEYPQYNLQQDNNTIFTDQIESLAKWVLSLPHFPKPGWEKTTEIKHKKRRRKSAETEGSSNNDR